jgi:chemotaxis protein CheY-P-specific phosphatase CheC
MYADTLKEIFSFASGHLAANLSKFLNQKVEIRPPEVKLELPEKYRMEEKQAHLGVYSKCSPPHESIILHLISKSEVIKFFENFRGEKVKEIGETEKSLLIEVGDILSNSVLSTIENILEKKIEIKPPCMVSDPYLFINNFIWNEQKRKLGTKVYCSVSIIVEKGTKRELTFKTFFFPFFDLVGSVWKKLTIKSLEDNPPIGKKG